MPRQTRAPLLQSSELAASPSAPDQIGLRCPVPDRTRASRLVLPVSRLVHGSHALLVLQVDLRVVRFKCCRGCGGRVRCARSSLSWDELPGDAAAAAGSAPVALVVDRSGSVRHRAAGLCGEFNIGHFSGKFVQNRRNDGKSPPSGAVTSNINHLLWRSADARRARSR